MTGPGRRTFAARHWPLFAALAAYWAAVAILTTLSVRANGGRLVYPMDDTYIHMAMAKNVALHHVWGVTRSGFTSTSSSPLWTAALAAAYWAFGVLEAMPLILNLLFGTLAVVVSYLFAMRYARHQAAVAGILAGVVFVTPLPTLTIIGMEHVLHALLSVCFLYLALPLLPDGDRPGRGVSMRLALAAALTTAARYEGLFLVFAVCGLFAWRRKFGQALGLAAAALLIPSLYGLWSIAHGWWFLPNSILLKGHLPGGTAWGVIDWVSLALKRLVGGQLAAMLAAILLILLITRDRDDEAIAPVRSASLVLAIVIVFQVLLASAGAFYRYEAYVVLLGVLVLGASAAALARARLITPVTSARGAGAAAVASVVLASFAQRALVSLPETVTATTNIYQQQYQMGLFLQRFYDGRTIVANDIGAISYLADIRLVDAWGLASLEPARRRLAGSYDTGAVSDAASQGGAAIAVLYDDWFERFGGLPREWQLAGRWTIPNNIVCGGDTVSFYAFDPAGASDLKGNLEQFARDLPRDVRQDGPYVAAAR